MASLRPDRSSTSGDCSPDFRKLKQLMRTAALFDGRNMWDPEIVRELGFHYFSIGR